MMFEAWVILPEIFHEVEIVCIYNSLLKSFNVGKSVKSLFWKSQTGRVEGAVEPAVQYDHNKIIKSYTNRKNFSYGSSYPSFNEI